MFRLTLRAAGDAVKGAWVQGGGADVTGGSGLPFSIPVKCRNIADMVQRPSYPPTDSDELDLPAGLYDADEDQSGDEAHWFLPSNEDPDEEGRAPYLPKLGKDAQTLADPAEWAAAEAGIAHDLALLAHDHGRLSERLRAMGEGPTERLANAEALAFGWWTGDRVAADRLALWLSLRIGATGDDAGEFTRIAWAARRLAAPNMGDDPAAHLGDSQHRMGNLPLEVGDVLSALDQLHPVTRGCAAFHLWRGLDDRPDHLRGIEAAVLGARIAAGRAAQTASLRFLPLAQAGFGGLAASGPPARKLAIWVTSAHQAVLASLMMLERLSLWQDRARAATEDLSGRTPGRLIDCLMRHAMVSAPLAQSGTAASRAAVQRNLDLFQKRDLVREVTGHGRFRVWTTQL